MKIPPEDAPNALVLLFFLHRTHGDAVRRILFYLSFNLEKGEVFCAAAPKMAVTTRSSSAKKVERKAVALKVTKSTREENVSWDDHYNQLLALSKKEGHCRPHHSSTLGRWCTQQRAHFQANLQANKPLLHQYQIKKLSTIGFQFCLCNKNPKKNLKWDDRYNQLVDYKNEHGHANPLQMDGQLGTWCHNQRKLFQNQFRSTGKATLFPYQEEKLAKIGFLFKQQNGRKRTLQRANLPATPDLLAWSDMPALPEIPTLPDMQPLSSLAPALPEIPTLPDMQTLSSLAISPSPNVIAV
jgi:hypothetical protein